MEVPFGRDVFAPDTPIHRTIYTAATRIIYIILIIRIIAKKFSCSSGVRLRNGDGSGLFFLDPKTGGGGEFGGQQTALAAFFSGPILAIRDSELPVGDIFVQQRVFDLLVQ